MVDNFKNMSNFKQMLKNISSPAITRRTNSTKNRDSKTKTFSRSATENTDSSFNRSRRLSMSTSALTDLKEKEVTLDDVFETRVDDRRDSNMTSVSGSTDVQFKSPAFIKELVENMIRALQLSERKNAMLVRTVKQLDSEKTSLKEELSSTKVELNLYKSRLQQIEDIANEWYCSICMDNRQAIIASKRQLVTTMCGHVFCSLCALSMLSTTRQSKNCPTCRKPIKDQLPYHAIFI